jgi:hypothetical protein
VNFGQAFAQAAMMGQQQGQGALQQSLMMRQAMEQKAKQQRIGQAVGGIVPQQYAQLAQDAPELALGLAPKPQAPQAFTAEDGSVRWAMPGQNLGPVARPGEPPKFDIKPIYDLQGNPMGEGAIDSTGNAHIGGQILPTGSYITAKPDKGGASSTEARLKAAHYTNAKASAEQYKRIVLGENPSVDEKGNVTSFNDFAARTPEAKRLLYDAIASKLRGDSGGAINEPEIQAETERWMASLFSSDKTNAAAVVRLLQQLDTLASSQGGPAIAASVAPNTPAPQLAAPLIPSQGVARGTVIQRPNGATITFE